MHGGGEFQTLSVHGTTFEIPTRYELVEVVGQGAYGMVCSATAMPNKEAVAIKKVEAAFEHTTFAKRLLRELRILRHMKHENLICVREVIIPKVADFQDLYVVTDLMETDLASILKSTQEVSADHRRFFLYQLLRGMKFIHAADVIHRDIKPRNLLVNGDCSLKICDFGLARLASLETAPGPMTEYVCTRWYRAPELLCSFGSYSTAMDVWSIGCVFAELLERKAVFPGKDTKNQLYLVMQAVGKPGDEQIKRIPNARCREFVAKFPRVANKLASQVPHASPDAMDLLRSMLVFAPEQRATVDQALAMPYLEELHLPDDEPSTSALDPLDFQFECHKLTMEAIRADLVYEVLTWHPDRKAEMEEAHRTVQTFVGPNGSCRRLLPGESAYSDDDDA